LELTMRSLIPVMLALSLAGPVGATQLKMVRLQPAVDLSRHEPQMATLSPSLRAWVISQARASLDGDAGPDPQVIAGNARARLEGQDFSDGDIESLVQRVMMESVRQADADLRDAMEQVRAANERKARMREAAAAQNEARKGLSEAARAEYSRPESKAVCVDPPCQFEVITKQPRLDQAKIVAPVGPGGSPVAAADPDSMSEMTEMEQMRMQMAMDRKSKAMQALSNLLKKSSDTAATITSNLK
jgi:hypothetical protein